MLAYLASLAIGVQLQTVPTFLDNQIKGMNAIMEVKNFKATSEGDYVEVYQNKVSYDVTTNTSYAYVVRYYQESAGIDKAHLYLVYLKNMSGKKTASEMIDDQQVLGDIKKLK